jgi:hypothetical protein
MEGSTVASLSVIFIFKEVLVAIVSFSESHLTIN